MTSQIIKIAITGDKTIKKINPVNLKRIRVSFLDYSEPNFRVYFEDNEHIVVEGGSGEITLKVYEA